MATVSKSICVSCGQHIEFPPELAGKQIGCPNCGAKTLLDGAPPPQPSIRIPKQRDPAEREPGSSPAAPLANRIIDNIEKVIVGKRNEIMLTLVAFLAEGHVLLEDVPGVAKTMLARALALSLGCKFKRIQCTPDLLPNDITGSSIFNPKTADFEFRPGPLFAQIVLADEINRATPRAQSALLEAMAERKTADYEEALARVEKLMDARPGTSQGDELEILSLVIYDYEERVFPIDKPDPVAAIRFRMAQQGLTNKDLVPFLGSRSRVSEVLSGRRSLSLKMIRALVCGLRIPADVLLGDIQRA